CCALTWISTGQLDTAERVLRRTVTALRPWIEAGTKVVGLEPSCTAVFRSDAPELLPDDEDVQRLSRQFRTFSELLLDEASEGWRPPSLGRSATVQTHCHQHAVMRYDADRELAAVPHLLRIAARRGVGGMAPAFAWPVGDRADALPSACGHAV
ncbi:hypothetical protein AN219_00690, partial [Streptomyces nanshensis]